MIRQGCTYRLADGRLARVIRRSETTIVLRYADGTTVALPLVSA